MSVSIMQITSPAPTSSPCCARSRTAHSRSATAHRRAALPRPSAHTALPRAATPHALARAHRARRRWISGPLSSCRSERAALKVLLPPRWRDPALTRGVKSGSCHCFGPRTSTDHSVIVPFFIVGERACARTRAQRRSRASPHVDAAGHKCRAQRRARSVRRRGSNGGAASARCSTMTPARTGMVCTTCSGRPARRRQGREGNPL